MEDITIPYTPRPAQREVHKLCTDHRFGVVVAHRRFGKSVCFANELIRRALGSKSGDWRGAFIGPTYAQAKSILWDELKRYTTVIPQGYVKFNESELRADFANGARIRLFGADNPDSLRGMYFDTVVFDEFDLQKMTMWSEVIRPAISDRRGQAYFIGTYKYVNGPLGLLYDGATPENWFRAVFKSSETNCVDADELEDAKTVMEEEEFAREYECKRVAAVHGSILGQYVDRAASEGRLSVVPHDPGLGVVTAWDLGMGDATAIWFAQTMGKEIRLIDYYEASGEGLPHYANVLSRKGYTYLDHIAPHDVAVRELGTGKSRLEMAMELGIIFRVLPRVSQKMQSEVSERIEQSRRMISRCWFDEVECKRGLEALRSWRREINNRTGELSQRPLHNWASHGSDAFTYLAMGLQERVTVRRPKPNLAWVH